MKFLTHEQLHEVFGTRQNAKLRRLLDEQGIHYWLDAKGRPVTTPRAFERDAKTEEEKPLSFT